MKVKMILPLSTVAVHRSIACLAMCLTVTFLLCFCQFCWSVPGDADLRILLQNEQNQNVIRQLGTRYEIVHPFQIRPDWGRGLSTKVSETNGTVYHIKKTSLLIDTYEYKLHLDLVLNTNLFAPTLVQLLYKKNGTTVALKKLPENCYYHATIRGYPEASAGFYTCNGIRGIIYLGRKIFYMHPLQGNNSGNFPHLLYHYFPEELFRCANTDGMKSILENSALNYPEEEAMLRNKYIETALVLDQTLIEEFKYPPEDIAAAALEIINYVNLLFQPLNTYVSLVYLELWEEDQMKFDTVMNETLSDFQDYTARKINRISVDAAHLLTGFKFDSDKNGLAFIDSICTANAAGLTRVDNHFQPHITSFILAHSIGHNLGMSHDQAHCKCSNYSACVMTNDVPLLSSAFFSNCSVGEFYQTLSKGYGACLFNMPTMRMSVCGNRITEEPEECDCGTVEECATENPCCDPMTCKLIKHAQCSSGPCCRKCKLLSPDHLCRSSKGECDIAEFCDGKSGECPEDLYKKNGAMCSDGNGYCFQGACPVLKQQCQEIWGQNADVADSVCFKRLNVLGTPYGNCGSDSDDQIHKCTVENSLCGLIQCSKGEVSTSDETLPIEYVVHKMNSQGRIHECKVRIFGSKDFKRNLVKDGTKCGYWKLCVNQTCTRVKDIVSGNCPSVDPELMCSGHGVCTNINTCVCDEGWKGLECNIVDEENKWRTTNEDSEYYDSIQESNMKPSYKGRNELNLHPNLVIIVIAASITIGLSLLLILFLFIIYRKL